MASIYTLLMSLAYFAIGIDSMVTLVKQWGYHPDTVILNAIYGLIVSLSVLLVCASISLMLGAARKLKSYVILWIIVLPFWTVFVFCHLVVLPMHIGHAITFSGLPSRLTIGIVIFIVNTFCFICVCLFFATLVRIPKSELKSVTVTEALNMGFSSGYGRLRASFRSVKGARAQYKKRDMPEPVQLSGGPITSVVLNPSALDSIQSAKMDNSTAVQSGGHDNAAFFPDL